MRHVWMVAVLILGSCTKPRPAESGEALATVGERVLTVAEVEQLIAAQPEFARVRYATPEGKKEFVDALVRTELLAQEARRRGVDSRPQVRALIDRLLIQQLTTELTQDGGPTEADARAYYESHPSEFERPQRVRVAVVVFGPKNEGEANRLVTAVQNARPDQRAALFSGLVQAHSVDQASRSQDGDIGPRTPEELSQQFSPAVSQACTELTQVGDVSAARPSPRGPVACRLLGRQQAETRPFETEKAQLLARLTAEWRAKQLDQVVRSLREQTTIQVSEEATARLKVAAPSGPLLRP